MLQSMRYSRQTSLPEISIADQQRLSRSKICMIGAGGLGSAALPYLAGAGIGHITIIDHDHISISNLHRQTIYKDQQTGQSKAEAAACYLADLNPDIDVKYHHAKVQDILAIDDAPQDFDLLLDGSDNFETKTYLNAVSIAHGIPLISASVNQFEGQVGIFSGAYKETPCYHCLFPELPTNARNCNEAGILGTSAGLTGMIQAHLSLQYLVGIHNVQDGCIVKMDFANLRNTKLKLSKNKNCSYCGNQERIKKHDKKDHTMDIKLIAMDELKNEKHLIVDVRTSGEIEDDPIDGAMHMELSSVPANFSHLPQDRLLAFVCAGNVRSAQAAEYVKAHGYDNVCILDKFSF